MRGTVVSPDRRASAAGAAVLADGGNAVDAVIAASAVLCVVLPHQASLGGDGVAMAWPEGAAAPSVLAGAGDLPAMPQLWGRLLERHGTLGLAPLMAPAAEAARGGWVVGAGVAEALAAEAERLGRDIEVWRLWPPVKLGMTLRNQALATTLDAIGRGGFGAFQFGALAGPVADALARRDGRAAEDRLRGYRLRWEMAAAAGGEYQAGVGDASVACGVCAADESGLTAALAHGFRRCFGSGVLVPGAGVLLGDGPAGAVAILTREGRRWAAVVAPDAEARAQVAARLRAGDTPAAAVAAPRVAGARPPLVEVTHPEARTLLREVPGARPMPFGAPAFGQVQVLAELEGAADPRGDGAAVTI